MAMLVEITNVTDAPDSKKSPTQVGVYTQKLDPGESLKLPAQMVDDRLRKLEKDGLIAIGKVPSWYEASKSRKGRPVLTSKDIVDRAKTKKVAQEAKLKKASPVAAPGEFVHSIKPVVTPEVATEEKTNPGSKKNR